MERAELREVVKKGEGGRERERKGWTERMACNFRAEPSNSPKATAI